MRRRPCESACQPSRSSCWPLPPALAPAAQAADGITRGTIYDDAPDNRYLVGGDWLFRLDTAGVGLDQNFQRETKTDGWAKTTVPNAWNAGDNSVASMLGTVGWYRKDFRLPDRRSRMSWILRFESINYRAKIWLNGKPIGRNTGAHLPFEIRVPRSAVKREGTNRLVIRVDNRRRSSDFPPSSEAPDGSPGGGWWNYGGLLREVYLQRVDGVDITNVRVRPNIACRTCAATVDVRVTVRNFADHAVPLRMTGTYGRRGLRLGSKRVPARVVRDVLGADQDRQAEAVVARERRTSTRSSCGSRPARASSSAIGSRAGSAR